MNPRTFQAATMAAALAKVKQELGRDAVILRTRTLKRGGILGIGARTLVEITASSDCEGVPRAGRREYSGVRQPAAPRVEPPVPRGPGANWPASPAASAERPRRAVVPEVPRGPAAPAAGVTPPAEWYRDVQDIKTMIEGMVQQGDRERIGTLPPELRRAYVRLVQNQVEESLAGKLVERIETGRAAGRALDETFVRDQLVRCISGILKSGCPIEVEGGQRKRIALVGPTGVGKTTTVAKLAAHFRIREKRRVGLVTLDNYRIAAVDQLKTYARIIDVPLEVVLEPSAAETALQRLGDCDIVLIDTAGRSQFDKARLSELGDVLKTVMPTETHLVLPASGSHAVLTKAVEHFGGLGVDRVIFTKVDEAVGIGTMLGVMQRVDARLSYVTNGQEVPRDIEPCDSQKLAKLIVEGCEGAAC